MVGAERAGGERLAVVEGGAHPDPDARQAGNRLDPAIELGGIEDALEALEAGGEVGDAHGVAGVVANDGLHDRRVALVGGLGRGLPLHRNVAEALFLIAGQKPREDRVGIEARKAPPDDASARIDQSRCAAIADDRQVEGLSLHVERHPQTPLTA